MNAVLNRAFERRAPGTMPRRYAKVAPFSVVGLVADAMWHDD